jgi:hypothetical protein
MTEETDADVYTTQTTHLRNGLEQLITRPDGSTVNTQYFLDGKIKQRNGTGIIPEYYSYTANAAGGMTTTVRLSSAVGVRYQATTVNLLGRTISQAIPGNGGAINGVGESAGINRLEIEYERDLQRKLSQSLWPRTLRWEQ